jgi:hypothetical protein
MVRQILKLDHLLLNIRTLEFFGWVRVAHRFSFLCCPIMSTFWVPCCDVRYDFCRKTIFRSYLPVVFCWRACVLYTLFVFVCVWWCPTHIGLCFCFVFPRLVPMFPVSLKCPLLIVPSVFSNVYLTNTSECPSFGGIFF